jgi:hypothetical protein
MNAWTEGDLAALKKYIAEGLSAGQAAKRFGGKYSRNACIGAARRHGWSFGGGLDPVLIVKKAMAEQETRRQGAAVRAMAARAAKPPRPEKPRRVAVPVEDLEPLGPPEELPDCHPAAARRCRAITGDPARPGWRCCWRPTPRNGKPYCEHHQVQFYNKSSDAGRPPHWLIPRGAAARMFG